MSWLEQIPSHWVEKRAKYFFREVDERSETGEEELLSVSHKTGITPRSEKNVTMFKAESYAGSKLCKPGDIVINTMWAWMAALGVSSHSGIVSPSYGVYRPLGEDAYSRLFLDNLLRTQSFVSEYICRSTGIRSSRLRLYPDQFLRIPFVYPPKGEQGIIEKYLRAKTTQIARFIQAKRKLIALLNEQKQAVINHAVTRGLDLNVRLKPSGVDYLGDIPEHWEVLKLKRIVGFNPSKQESAKYLQRNDNVVFLPMEKVSTEGEINCTEVRPVTELWSGFTYFAKNDIVVAKITPCFENGKGACLDKLETPIGFGTTEFIVMRPGGRILPKYLYYITRFSRFRILGEEAMTGAAGQQRVPTDFMKNFQCGLPEKSEQAQIVEQIEDELSKVEHLIERAKMEIDLIREYRTRLISDVVTGKLEVRGIEVEDVDASEVLGDLDEAEENTLTEEAEEDLSDHD